MDGTSKHAGAAGDSPEYRIGRVTKELDLGQYTLKHYERAGLIEPATSESGFRFYTRQDFGKIITIRSLRRLGFSVEEVGELLRLDPADALAAMGDKLADNERVIAELKEANHLLHRHISSLRNNLERPVSGVFDPEAAGLVFVSHFRGDELAGGSELVDTCAWRSVYERSLLGLRIERDSVAGEGLEGCWWGLVPLGDQSDVRAAMEQERPSSGARIIDVPIGPALLLSLEARSDGEVFDRLRTAVGEALAAHGCELAADVLAISDSVGLSAGTGVLQLTVRIPVVDVS